jgi:hypothetical protein
MAGRDGQVITGGLRAMAVASFVTFVLDEADEGLKEKKRM